MNLSELQSEVLSLVNRPELLNTTILAAIKSATLKLHQMDFFAKDLFETVFTFPSAEFLQTLDYATNIPRWRALKYVVRVDPTSGEPIYPALKVLTPEELIDSYNIPKVNVVYQAGSNLQIKCNAEIQTFALGCYLSPDVGTLTYTSWIAVEYPYAIVFEGAAAVFKSIGFKEEEQSMRLLAGEQQVLIQRNNIQTEGY
mgnify:FL=1